MGQQRKSWSVEQKLSIVLSALKGDQSVAELSRQHGVNENQIYRWKDQFLESGRQGQYPCLSSKVERIRKIYHNSTAFVCDRDHIPIKIAF